MENEKEVWKDVVGYECKYQVSNFGNVKSLNYRRTNKEEILKQFLNRDGYFQVVLCKNSKIKAFNVHVLVAMCFLNHIPDGTHNLVVDHKNNIKIDNKVSNLNLITHRKNTSKDRKGYTSKYIGVCWAKQHGKWKAQIQINGKIKNIGYFTNEIEASKSYQKELNNINTLNIINNGKN